MYVEESLPAIVVNECRQLGCYTLGEAALTWPLYPAIPPQTLPPIIDVRWIMMRFLVDRGMVVIYVKERYHVV